MSDVKVERVEAGCGCHIDVRTAHYNTDVHVIESVTIIWPCFAHGGGNG